MTMIVQRTGPKYMTEMFHMIETWPIKKVKNLDPWISNLAYFCWATTPPCSIPWDSKFIYMG